MEPPYLLSLLSPRLRDRARAIAFFRFLGRRSLDDNLFQAAGALSFTTVFSLVPLAMVVFGILAAFPAFANWSTQLSDYLFSNFVPSAARSAQGYLLLALKNSGNLTAAGVVGVVVALLVTLTSVESTFNAIWRVKSARPKFSRFLVYWTVMTLGAVLAAASLAVSAQFFELAVFKSTRVGHALESFMLQVTPLAIEVAAFTTIYRVVPHRTVKWRHAFSGAVIATSLFELAKWGMSVYLTSFNSYELIYQKLAVAPILLLWIYFGWTSILLGASFAASVSAFRYQPVAQRLPEGYEMYGLLRLLARFEQSRKHGRGLHSEEIRVLEPILTDALVQEMLGQLCEIHVVRRAEGGEWLLARDLDELTLADLYEACQLRIPVSEAHLPCRDDELGVAITGVIDELRIPLRDLLKRRVNTLWVGKEILP